MKPDQITAQETKNLLNLYNEKLWREIKEDDAIIKYIIIDRIIETTKFFNSSMTCSTHKLIGLKFDKENYINVKLQNTPYSPKIDFTCKGVGYLSNAKGIYVMYGKIKREKTNGVEIMDKLSHEDLNKLFETCLKYIGL